MPNVRTNRTYACWQNMKARYNNPNRDDYARYGALGVTYDSRWESFELFLLDMGNIPEGLTIDRIDSRKGYSKDNCRWATYSEQNLNKGSYRNNTSGCKGVSWHVKNSKWITYGNCQGTRKTLYYGLDFFEACCARKSWEFKLSLS